MIVWFLNNYPTWVWRDVTDGETTTCTNEITPFRGVLARSGYLRPPRRTAQDRRTARADRFALGFCGERLAPSMSARGPLLSFRPTEPIQGRLARRHTQQRWTNPLGSVRLILRDPLELSERQHRSSAPLGPAASVARGRSAIFPGLDPTSRLDCRPALTPG